MNDQGVFYICLSRSICTIQTFQHIQVNLDRITFYFPSILFSKV